MPQLQSPTQRRTLLLGAGASKGAGLPLASELIELLFEELDEAATPPVRIQREAFDVALKGLRFNKPRGTVDVEALYQTLLELSTRDDNPLAPFVGAWHASVLRVERDQIATSATKVANALSADLQRILSDAMQAGRLGASSRTLERFRDALSDALRLGMGNDSTIFRQAADVVLRYAASKCWVADANAADVDFLQPLLLSSAVRPLWIATLNYDNVVELAAQRANVSIDRGIVSGTKSIQFDARSPVTLAKLHGSLDWTQTSEGIINVIAPPRPAGQWPALIFGAGNKLRVAGPYLDLLLAFKQQLNATVELDVCGYSFRDEHINYLILSWLQGSPERHVNVVDPHLKLSSLKENLDATLAGTRAEFTWNSRYARPRLDDAWIAKQFKLNALSMADWAAQTSRA